MMALVRALSAEILKLKRTLALWLVIIAPLIVVCLRLIDWTQRGEFYLYPGVNPWVRLAQSIIVLWGMLMLPLFVTLETALLGGLEHAGKQWKYLFALPVPRWAIYVAKLLVSAGMVGLSTLVLWAGILLAGIGLQFFNRELGFTGPIPWLWILGLTLLAYLASWLVLSIHTWISMRWHSFTLAIGVGIAATFIGLLASSTEVGRVYPWSLPMDVVFGEGERLPLAVALGIIGGIVVGVVGCWDVTRRDVL